MFNPNNPLFNQFGGFNDFQAGVNQFVQNQFGQGCAPQSAVQQAQQMIQQGLNSGQIAQQDFETARQFVNQLTGMNR